LAKRDQRCAGQISEVTNRLEGIASLDDLAEIARFDREERRRPENIGREKTAESKTGHRPAPGGGCGVQARLEEAEEAASRDLLTGVRSRLYAESQIERRIAAELRIASRSSISTVQTVNDEHGHLVGDELLKQFASELRSACRSTDVIARLGRDEFILVLDCGLREAGAQMDRLRKWVFGSYTVQGSSAPRS